MVCVEGRGWGDVVVWDNFLDGSLMLDVSRFSITGWKIGWLIGPEYLVKPAALAHQWVAFSIRYLYIHKMTTNNSMYFLIYILFIYYFVVYFGMKSKHSCFCSWSLRFAVLRCRKLWHTPCGWPSNHSPPTHPITTTSAPNVRHPISCLLYFGEMEGGREREEEEEAVDKIACSD
jgi:hypothetical protein